METAAVHLDRKTVGNRSDARFETVAGMEHRIDAGLHSNHCGSGLGGNLDWLPVDADLETHRRKRLLPSLAHWLTPRTAGRLSEPNSRECSSAAAAATSSSSAQAGCSGGRRLK